jgi:N-acetylneuraminic acid mutarotase
MKRIVAILMTLIMVFGLSSVGVWADEATWQEETPMLTPIQSMTTEAIGNKAYLFGGSIPSNTSTNTMAIYDSTTKTWSYGKSIPTARSSMCSAAIGNKIYVIGGAPTNIMDIYDTETDTWTTGTPMPTKRSGMTCSSVGTKIYVIGGNDSGVIFDTVEIYDTETKTWTTGTPMPTKRSSLTSFTYYKKVYVVGGSDAGVYTNTMEIYDTESNTWATGVPMPAVRAGMKAAIIGSKAYVMGGSNRSNIVEIYDVETKTWTTGPSMITGRGAFSTFIVNDRIYALGGRDLVGMINSMESLQVTPISTTPEAPSNLTATGGNSIVELSWGAASGADSYTVKRSLTAGGPYTVIAEDVTGTTYSDKDVVNGTTYYYVVNAVSAGGESANSNEASATPQAQTSSGRALLVITMTNGLEKEYDLQMSEVNSFVSWYDSKAAGNGQGYYTFNKTFNLGPFMNRMDYLTFDKIQNFEVKQYQ